MNKPLPPKQLQMATDAKRAQSLPSPQVPDGYELRGYQPGDEESWLALQHLGGFTHWDLEGIEKYLEDPVRRDGSQVVTTGDRLVAATFATPHKSLDGVGYLDWVVSDPDCRGLGLGRAVCSGVMRFFVEHGYDSIILLTDDWRLPAISLYLSLGFDPVTEREDMPTRWQAIMAELEKPRSAGPFGPPSTDS
jgi:mycothiol synthase